MFKQTLVFEIEVATNVSTAYISLCGLCYGLFHYECDDQLVSKIINIRVISTQLFCVHAIPNNIAIIDGFSDIISSYR
jgi:hypothetical protein